MISFKSFLQLLFCAALVLSCSKKDKSVEPSQNSRDPKSQLMGTWHRQYFVYAWTGDTTFSGTDGYTHEYEFYSEDSVISRKYLHGNIIASKRDTFHYHFEHHYNGLDSVQQLYIGPIGHKYYLTKDTLTLDTRHADLGFELYTKN